MGKHLQQINQRFLRINPHAEEYLNMEQLTGFVRESMKVVPTDPYRPRTIVPHRSGKSFQFDSSGKRPPTF